MLLQGAEEREVDVMMRVVAMDEAAIFTRRHALCQLRQDLGGRAAETLRAALEATAASGS